MRQIPTKNQNTPMGIRILVYAECKVLCRFPPYLLGYRYSETVQEITVYLYQQPVIVPRPEAWLLDGGGDSDSEACDLGYWRLDPQDGRAAADCSQAEIGL